MALLTEQRDAPQRGIRRFYRNVPLAANVVIFAGAAVGISAAGFAGPAGTTYPRVIGMAEDTVDNTGGAAGAKRTTLLRGEFLFDNEPTFPLTNVHLGTAPEWTDDHSAANTGSAATAVGGILVEVTSAGVWIEF